MCVCVGRGGGALSRCARRLFVGPSHVATPPAHSRTQDADQVIVDGPVDAPDTLGKMIGKDAFANLRASLGAQDGLILPSAVADTYFHLANQHRSAWTFECDLRAWRDTPWWNHG